MRHGPECYADRNLSQLNDLAGALQTEWRKNPMFRESDAGKIDWAIREIIRLWKQPATLWLAVSDTNYGVGVHGVFTTLIQAKADFPGVWTVSGEGKWHTEQLPCNGWPVYLIPTKANVTNDEWVVHDGR